MGRTVVWDCTRESTTRTRLPDQRIPGVDFRNELERATPGMVSSTCMSVSHEQSGNYRLEAGRFTLYRNHMRVTDPSSESNLSTSKTSFCDFTVDVSFPPPLSIAEYPYDFDAQPAFLDAPEAIMASFSSYCTASCCQVNPSTNSLPHLTSLSHNPVSSIRRSNPSSNSLLES